MAVPHSNYHSLNTNYARAQEYGAIYENKSLIDLVEKKSTFEFVKKVGLETKIDCIEKNFQESLRGLEFIDELQAQKESSGTGEKLETNYINILKEIALRKKVEVVVDSFSEDLPMLEIMYCLKDLECPSENISSLVCDLVFNHDKPSFYKGDTGIYEQVSNSLKSLLFPENEDLRRKFDIWKEGLVSDIVLAKDFTGIDNVENSKSNVKKFFDLFSTCTLFTDIFPNTDDVVISKDVLQKMGGSSFSPVGVFKSAFSMEISIRKNVLKSLLPDDFDLKMFDIREGYYDQYLKSLEDLNKDDVFSGVASGELKADERYKCFCNKVRLIFDLIRKSDENTILDIQKNETLQNILIQLAKFFLKDRQSGSERVKNLLRVSEVGSVLDIFFSSLAHRVLSQSR